VFIIPPAQKVNNIHLLTGYEGNNTFIGATCRAGTAYPSGAHEFASVFTYLIGVCVVQVVKLHVFTFLVPCCDVCYDFRVKTNM
jgi:hypothetical protein